MSFIAVAAYSKPRLTQDGRLSSTDARNTKRKVYLSSQRLTKILFTHDNQIAMILRIALLHKHDAVVLGQPLSPPLYPLAFSWASN